MPLHLEQHAKVFLGYLEKKVNEYISQFIRDNCPPSQAPTAIFSPKRYRFALEEINAVKKERKKNKSEINKSLFCWKTWRHEVIHQQKSHILEHEIFE